MKYDFKTVVNRANTGSAKWEQMKSWNPNVSEGIVPFSVADMEFKNAPEIVEGLKKYIDSTILGYTQPTEDYLNAVCGWMKRRHDWEIKPEWIVGSAGVVGAFFSAVKAFSNPGDGIMIMTPAYYPFYNAIERNNRMLVKSPLINNGSTYLIDYEDLEKKAQDPNTKILLFCSPHNPVGRVWSKEELKRVGEICLRNNVLIVSDEIHFDLVMPSYKHIVFASISQELANNMIVCTAPSKTFNLAGMHTSNIIIPNKKLRGEYLKEVESNGFFSLNILGYKACEIAYTECEDWLDELLKVIYHNHLELKKYIEQNIPAIRVYNLEGTYLQWMDFNGLGLDKDKLEKLMHEEAELFFDEGFVFGEEGNGFERMNLACPTSVLIQALERLKKTIDRLFFGMKAPDFNFATPWNSNNNFYNSLKGKKNILVFLRYYGCTVCQLQILNFIDNYNKFVKKDIQLFVVLQSEAETIRNQNEEKDIPFTIICDPSQELYKLYNVAPAKNKLELVSPKLFKKKSEIEKLGLVHGKYEGNELQLPATFLINGEGVLEYAHYGKDAGDVPEIEQLLEM